MFELASLLFVWQIKNLKLLKSTDFCNFNELLVAQCVLFVTVLTEICFTFRSENNVQEELFDQILRGKLEFPSPDWDNISLSAKVWISFWKINVRFQPVNLYQGCSLSVIQQHA